MSDLWLVTASVEKETSFWVRADSREAAEEAAQSLVDALPEDEWHVDEPVVSVASGRHIRREPAEDDLLWSGGPEGHWIEIRDDTPEERR